MKTKPGKATPINPEKKLKKVILYMLNRRINQAMKEKRG